MTASISLPHSAALADGGRAVFVQDARAAVAEVRVRWRAKAWALSDPVRAQELMGALNSDALRDSRCVALGGSFSLALDGEWIDVTGHITAGELPAWFDTLATLFDARVDVEKSAATRSRLRDPGHFALADIALRRAVLGTSPVNPEARISLDSVVDPGAVVAIVADVDPVSMEQQLSRVRSAPYYEAPLDPPASTIPAPDSLPPVLEVPYPVPGLRSVTVSSIRFGAPSESLDPAAYVALTSFGSYHGSRLVRRIARRGTSGYEAFSGRDSFLGSPRTYVRALTTPEMARDAAAEAEDEMRCVAEVSMTADEIGSARSFCSAQLSSMTDSPECLADVLYTSVSSGSDPLDVLGLSQAVAGIGDDEVRRAARKLVAGDTIVTTVVGTV